MCWAGLKMGDKKAAAVLAGTHRQMDTHASWAVRNDPPLYARMPLPPFFEATPPGATPGPLVKTGALVRCFRGCNDSFMFGERCQRRPGFGRLCSLAGLPVLSTICVRRWTIGFSTSFWKDLSWRATRLTAAPLEDQLSFVGEKWMFSKRRTRAEGISELERRFVAIWAQAFLWEGTT